MINNEYVTFADIKGTQFFIKQPDPPISTIIIGDGSHTWAIGVDKKFNWFQKQMIKWCFGFEVKEN